MGRAERRAGRDGVGHPGAPHLAHQQGFILRAFIQAPLNKRNVSGPPIPLVQMLVRVVMLLHLLVVVFVTFFVHGHFGGLLALQLGLHGGG